MEITTEAVYIKDSDINIRGNIILELSTAVNKLWPGEALGAQKFHQVWKIYVRSPRTRAALIVNGLMINGVNINVHDDNPVNDNNKQSERVVIKDLPATLSADRILSLLRGLPQIRVKSKVMYAKERIGGEEMSPFINGDRLVYITPITPVHPYPKRLLLGVIRVAYGTDHKITTAKGVIPTVTAPQTLDCACHTNMMRQSFRLEQIPIHSLTSLNAQ